MKDLLTKVINDRNRSQSTKDAFAMLTGRDDRIIAKPAKKRTRKQKAERAAKLEAFKAKRNGEVLGGSQADPSVKESERELAKEDEEYLLSQFPEGTVLNDDQTLTLPDGRMIRKIPEV